MPLAVPQLTAPTWAIVFLVFMVIVISGGDTVTV